MSTGSKAKRLREAADELERDRWRCLTCDQPADGNDDHCRYCRTYWNDVKEGLFDDSHDQDQESLAAPATRAAQQGGRLQ